MPSNNQYLSHFVITGITSQEVQFSNQTMNQFFKQQGVKSKFTTEIPQISQIDDEGNKIAFCFTNRLCRCRFQRPS